MSSVPLSRGQKRSLASAAEAYHSQLDEGARAYLEKRGLGSDQAIESLRFGVVRSPRPEHTMMRDRLAIPYIGPKGNVYDIRYRCIQDHDCKEASCPKYLGSDGVETRIYNARSLVAPTDYIMVTEGELDAASLTVCGWPAVGLPGANAWKSHYPRLFSGFSRVILLADDDEAGRKLASTFRRAMVSSGTVMVCGYKDAHDVNDILVRYGKDGLMDFLKKGMSDDEE